MNCETSRNRKRIQNQRVLGVLRRYQARPFVLVCVTTLVMVSQVSVMHAKDVPVLRAGAATSNITPPLGSPIIGNWNSPPATHVHDELHARCLVLDNGATQLAIVVCDNATIDRQVFDDAQRRLVEKTHIPTEHMLFAATHTHSGPSARQGNSLQLYDELTPYQQFLADRIVDGVIRAVNNLEPAKIGWGSGSLPGQVFNRRWHVDDSSLLANPFGKEDRVRMNPPRGHPSLVRPAGPTDPEIAFLSVQSIDGRPISLLANYSLHYVGGVSGGHISADYFAVFADRIQELLRADRLDPPFVGILSNGTSGDVNNYNFRTPRKRAKPYEQMHRVANQVAAEVYEAYRQIEYHDHVKLAGVKTELRLNVRKPDESLVLWANETLESQRPSHRLAPIYAERVLVLHDSPDHVDVWIQTLRIGEVGIAAIPFEVFAETGLQIKKESPMAMTFTIELANGGYGYLPPPRHHELGGYETWIGTSRVHPDSEPAIVKTLLGQLNELHDAP